MTDEATPRLDGLRVAVLVANEGVEQVELTAPWNALEDAGAEPVLIAPETGKVQAFDHLTKADTFEATVSTADANLGDYAALVLPGGVANPDQLRMDEDAVALVRSAASAGRPIAAICHAPWLLVEARVVGARTLTSWPSLRTDIRNAGGMWIDDEVVVCDNGPNVLVTSRNPDDLPAFTERMVATLAVGALGMSQYSADGAQPVDDAAVDDPPTVDEVLERQAERDDLPDPSDDPDHQQIVDDEEQIVDDEADAGSE